MTPNREYCDLPESLLEFPMLRVHDSAPSFFNLSRYPGSCDLLGPCVELEQNKVVFKVFSITEAVRTTY